MKTASTLTPCWYTVIIVRWACSSLSRNFARSTVTTKRRGLKLSFTSSTSQLWPLDLQSGSLIPRTLRSHQAELLAVVRAIAAGEAGGVRDVLAAVAPGGGKSLLPVLAAQALIAAGICERIC